MTAANRYFRDLKDLIVPIGDDGLYDVLLKHMMSTQFISLVPFDENRISDVQALREEMVEDPSYLEDFNTIFGEATVLEVLYILAKQMDFVTDSEDMDVKYFFWMLCCNITEAGTMEELQSLDDLDLLWALKRFVKREYNKDGTHGGAFPIKGTRKNLRNMELWYQMQEYILKNRLI